MENANKDIMDALQYIMANMATKDELTEVKQEVRDTNQKIVTVETDILHELKLIKEGVTALDTHYEHLDIVESTLEEHDHRLFAVEEQLKKA